MSHATEFLLMEFWISHLYADNQISPYLYRHENKKEKSLRQRI